MVEAHRGGGLQVSSLVLNGEWASIEWIPIAHPMRS